MEKIDRLGWTAGIAIKSYGLKIGIRTNNAGVLERIQGCLPPNWQPARSPFVDHLFSLKIGGPSTRSNVRNYNLLYGGLARLARTMDTEELFRTLENELQLFVAEWAQKRVFVHAGVVGWKGRAIVIPGRSMAGKSTLVAALVRAGASYYSDEYAVLDGHGYVHPFPRLLALRQPDGKRPQRVSAQELGGAAGTKPLPVGLVAVTKYLPGSAWKPRCLTPGAAVLELLDNSIPTLRQPELVWNTLNRLAPGTRHVKGMRGEARETAHALLAEMDRAALPLAA
jgi:hypothetical protein